MKSYLAKKNELKKKWFLIDADGKVLGRLAVRVAIILRGKHKPEYTPYVDCGDGVVVINAAKIKVTGKKLDEKMYAVFTGYPGGYKQRSLAHMMKRDPTKVVRLAVKRMIPNSPLGRDMIKKLKIYAGAEHDQKAQNPEALKI